MIDQLVRARGRLCHVPTDVDDLQEGKGAESVDASAVTLVFAKSPYFERPNCVRELLRAVVMRKPLITLLEPDQVHAWE